jgi:predicted  nucleic acid-binding Zn-ribbon protein
MLASCPNCGKPYANPFTHVCASKRGDFGRRKAAHEKAQKAAAKAAQPKHQYQTCRDEDCRRFGCVAYRDGYDNGFAAAAAIGEARAGK